MPSGMQRHRSGVEVRKWETCWKERRGGGGWGWKIHWLLSAARICLLSIEMTWVAIFAAVMTTFYVAVDEKWGTMKESTERPRHDKLSGAVLSRIKHFIWNPERTSIRNLICTSKSHHFNKVWSYFWFGPRGSPMVSLSHLLHLLEFRWKPAV